MAFASGLSFLIFVIFLWLTNDSCCQNIVSRTLKLAGSTTSSAASIQMTVASPPYGDLFRSPLFVPPIAQPIFTASVDGRQVQYFEVTIQRFSQQIFPELGPANMIGYNGTTPGPTFYIERGTETIIRYLNNGSQVSAIHLHGSYTHSVWDGWASDGLQPGQWKDYYYPNSESARPMWYHDHALGVSSRNVYYGQSGCWIIHDTAEDSLGLPSGKYDVPLSITDKTYQGNGDLISPDGNLLGFFGDTIEVNGKPWPYLDVEPRKYRLRFFDMSLSRCYQLYFSNEDGDRVSFQVIASDSGLFGAPITADDITISSGERYEVIFDFSPFRGHNITLMNGLQSSLIPSASDTDKVMRFVVGDVVADNANNGLVPSVLNDNIPWPARHATVDHVFEFQNGEENRWTINGVDFNDVNNRVLARPPQGTVERWQLHHAGGAVFHPVHIHLVNMQVVSRSGGLRGLLPYEAAGLKDVVLLEPGETVEVLAVYGPWNGLYMFHCHDLIHEDNTMLDAFNSTFLAQLGYNSTQNFADPMNSAFSAQNYSAAAFEAHAISSAVMSLAELDPYGAASSLLAEESAYYQRTASSSDLEVTLPLIGTIGLLVSLQTAATTTDTASRITLPASTDVPSLKTITDSQLTTQPKTSAFSLP